MPQELINAVSGGTSGGQDVKDQIGDRDETTQFIKRISETITLKELPTRLTKQYIYDSFILNHPVNSLLNMGTLLDNMEAVGNWVGTGGDFNFTLAASATQAQVGTNSLKCTWSSNSGTGYVTDSTTSLGDISTYTGAASGAPTKGMTGVWMYLDDVSKLTAPIKMRIGSSASDYNEYNLEEYTTADYDDIANRTTVLTNGWNLLQANMDSVDATAGTPDWTAVDYVRFQFDLNGTNAGDLYLDYFTTSKSDYLSLNGLGNRIGDEIVQRVICPNNRFREYFRDTTFKDATNTTATWDTTNFYADFTSGQVLQTNEIYKDTTTITEVYPIITIDSGSFTIQISNDASTWETVTNNQWNTLSNTGTTLYLKITEAAASTGRISSPMILDLKE